MVKIIFYLNINGDLMKATLTTKRKIQTQGSVINITESRIVEFDNFKIKDNKLSFLEMIKHYGKIPKQFYYCDTDSALILTVIELDDLIEFSTIINIKEDNVNKINKSTEFDVKIDFNEILNKNKS